MLHSLSPSPQQIEAHPNQKLVEVNANAQHARHRPLGAGQAQRLRGDVSGRPSATALRLLLQVKCSRRPVSRIMRCHPTRLQLQLLPRLSKHMLSPAEQIKRPPTKPSPARFQRTGTPGTPVLSLVAVLVTDARPSPGLAPAQGQGACKVGCNGQQVQVGGGWRLDSCSGTLELRRPAPKHAHANKKLACIRRTPVLFKQVSQQGAAIAHQLHLGGLAPVPHCRGAWAVEEGGLGKKQMQLIPAAHK